MFLRIRMFLPIVAVLVFFGASSGWAAGADAASEVETYKAVFEKNSADIRKSLVPKFEALQLQYRKSLEALRDKAQGQGDLKTTKAVLAELERFEKARTLPAVADATASAEIKKLQDVYILQFNKLDSELSARLSDLTRKYAQALDRLVKELTKSGKIDQATAVDKELTKANTLLSQFQVPSASIWNQVASSPDDGNTAQNKENAEVLIPAGSNSGKDPDNGPYKLSLPQPLYMDACEVSKNKWDDVYKWAVINGYQFTNPGRAKGPEHPVVCVSWFDSVRWCNARSEKNGLKPCYTVGGKVYRSGDAIPECDFTANGYRLPTLAEHHYAARGGLSGKRFPWGDEIDHGHANYRGATHQPYDRSQQKDNHPDYADGTRPYTSPVGSFAPNGYGLYDMSGNVMEHCWDATGANRMVSGGGWEHEADWMRCDFSWYVKPDHTSLADGFRTVRLAPEATVAGSTPPPTVAAADSTRKPEQAVPSSSPLFKNMPYWRTLLLVYPGIDSDYIDKTGKRQHVKYTMSPDEIEWGVCNFRNCASLVSLGSNREGFMLPDIVYVERPLTSLTARGSDSCWPSPADTRPELEEYAQEYDSVLVYFVPGNTQTKQFIPTDYWGLGRGPNNGAKGATYAAVMYVPEWMWGNNNSYNRGQIWLHEWLHGVCAYYRDRKVPMAESDADGGGGHHYVNSTERGWMDFYHDLMTGNVKEGSKRLGITPKAWQSGSPRDRSARIFADHFWTNTLSYYAVTGDCTWEADQHRILLGGKANVRHSLISTVAFQKSYVVTGRIMVPELTAAGGGASTSLLVRHGQSEVAGTLAYETADAGRSTLMIAKDGMAGTPPTPIELKPGWQTVKLSVEHGSGLFRMKVWPDDANEPDWQVSRSFAIGWPATGVGYRHEGTKPACLDDLYAMDVVLKNPAESSKRTTSGRR